VWGLDLVGPLLKAPGGFSHLLVAIDKFSKWIEVRPLTSIRSEQAVAFFTNIVHRFGVPNSIITDNGTQFTGKKFLDFCEDHHIRGLGRRSSPHDKWAGGACQRYDFAGT
jgi:transposase InsO family protein